MVKQAGKARKVEENKQEGPSKPITREDMKVMGIGYQQKEGPPKALPAASGEGKEMVITTANSSGKSEANVEFKDNPVEREASIIRLMEAKENLANMAIELAKMIEMEKSKEIPEDVRVLEKESIGAQMMLIKAQTIKIQRMQKVIALYWPGKHFVIGELIVQRFSSKV